MRTTSILGLSFGPWIVDTAFAADFFIGERAVSDQFIVFPNKEDILKEVLRAEADNSLAKIFVVASRDGEKLFYGIHNNPKVRSGGHISLLRQFDIGIGNHGGNPDFKKFHGYMSFPYKIGDEAGDALAHGIHFRNSFVSGPLNGLHQSAPMSLGQDVFLKISDMTGMPLTTVNHSIAEAIHNGNMHRYSTFKSFIYLNFKQNEQFLPDLFLRDGIPNQVLPHAVPALNTFAGASRASPATVVSPESILAEIDSNASTGKSARGGKGAIRGGAYFPGTDLIIETLKEDCPQTTNRVESWVDRMTPWWIGDCIQAASDIEEAVASRYQSTMSRFTTWSYPIWRVPGEVIQLQVRALNDAAHGRRYPIYHSWQQPIY